MISPQRGLSIDAKTSVPLFAVVSLLPFLIGGIVWLTNIDAKASESLRKTKIHDKSLRRIENSLVRLEVKNKTLKPGTEYLPDDDE